MFLARLTGKRPAGSGRWIVCIWWSLLSLSFPSPMGAYTTNLEFPLGFNLRETLQCNKEKKIPFCLRDIAHAAPVFDCYQAEVFYCFLLLWSWLSTELFFFFFLLQVSVPPQKTSPTRSRTCGQSAAQTLEGRTLWPVQMGRSQAMVGECHIPARLAKPSVQCLSCLNSSSQNYQSLSPSQLPLSLITVLVLKSCNC